MTPSGIRAATASTPPASSPSATTAACTTSACPSDDAATTSSALIDDLDIRVLDHATGQLIRKLTLDPTRDYQALRVKCGNSPENRP
jgi:hypothetical protein